MHIEIALAYATTSQCNGNKKLDREGLSELHILGCKHIGLWNTGGLYPLDPLIGGPLTFHNVSSFLEFVGDDHKGQLGYYNCIGHNDVQAHFVKSQLLVVLEAYQKLQGDVKNLHDR